MTVLPTVAIVLKVTVGRGDVDRVLNWYGSVDRFASEPGTVVYVLNRAIGDDGTFWVYEMFADDAAFTEHRNGPLAAQFRELMREVGGVVESTLCAPVWAKGTGA
jgi:(4S)-4-hydroxy-5-phosphonooxypentane-2,3-dione isomerase